MPQTFNREEEPNHASDAAQQLAESEAKFSAIFHNSSAFMSIVTEAEAKYVDVNQTSCELFGVKREDVIGRSPAEFNFYAEPAQRVTLGELLNRDGYAHDFEVKWRIKSGEILTHLLNADRITINGQPCLLVISNDITERNYRESNLAFLADVSKDFAPLSSVAEIMELAGERTAEYLKLSHCLFTEINEAADEAIVLYDRHAPDAPDLVGVYRLAEFHTKAEREQLSAGKQLVINDVWHEPRSAFAAAEFESLGIRALVTAPYLSRGKWSFALSAQHNHPYQWREDECELLDVLAAQVYVRIERARVEAALRESEAHMNAILQNTNSIIYLLDAENRFVHANRLWKELSNFTVDEVRGKSLYHVFPTEFADAFVANNNRVLESGQTIEFEEIAPLADGEHIYHSVKAPRLDANGKAYGIVGISTDITERKRKEQNLAFLASVSKDFAPLSSVAEIMELAGERTAQYLKLSHCVFTEIKEAADEAIILYDRHAPDAPNLAGVYRLTEFHTKAEREQLSAGKLLVINDVRQETRSAFAAEFESLGVRALVTAPYHSRGKWSFALSAQHNHPYQWREDECELLDVLAAQVYVRIERARVEAERAHLLTEAQRLRAIAEAATLAKNEFLAVVSHELRNPLNSMLGYARLMRANPHDAAQVANYAEIVERNARMQQQLIEDLLDTARIISGKLKIETAPTDLRLVLADALAVVRAAAEAKQIELRATLGDEPQSLIGDAARLQQVAWNLLQNAIKFTPAQGRVELRLEKTNDAKTGDEHLCMIVSDTGKGIEPEFLPSIFDRFTQQDMSSTRRHGGLGLGLTLAKQLVELHGGVISVTSPGRDQGSTFTVRLPQRTSHQAASAHISVFDTAALNSFKSLVHLDGLRLLVVDDQEEARQLLTHTLREGGASVTVAESGFAALALLEQQLFDLLICDIAMPEMDGYELLRRLREQSPGSQRLPAIALTAHSRPQDRLRALAAGFQMHIAKPVEPEELITVIASLTGRL